MNKVMSKDGAKIAYDKIGSGPLVILVAGALSTRLSWNKLPQLLSLHFTVITYDRRGRGDSVDNLPYSPEREVEDIGALIDIGGGSADLYGHSSGGALALEASSKLGKKVRKLAVYEAPYFVEKKARKEAVEYDRQLRELLSAGNRGDAVALFMKRLGMPDNKVQGMRTATVWPALEAMAPTLAYENSVMGESFEIPKERVAKISVPTLVMDGGASLAFMQATARELARIIPNAQHRTLKGQTHNVKDEVMAPVLTEFFSCNNG
jgi:pimeloyl-ACP methyl ester carboxylesterase